MPRHFIAIMVLMAPILISPAAIASGSNSDNLAAPSPAMQSDDYAGALNAIKANDFTHATQLLNRHLQRNPGDADAWNWLGYASRKAGNLPNAFAAYEKALAINPRHRGAYEYLGEAYLMSNNLVKAQAQLKRLDELCPSSCEERKDLQVAIAQYQSKHPVQ
ncbi:tetratricopeptide repeat protein [Paludibacterium purpuratum]|uniref:Tetratricopeptide repeat protein n=1 Tax=Paludibacterium purpuratum TaxID=1144873 RepID=A0A4V6PZC1_9NEIS|nr:tetratricopeptide repeat protein [Paludibacterium purpuratum]TDR82959.1 tetratricopeptide repeat protein [Paludibacterium purpuratum]